MGILTVIFLIMLLLNLKTLYVADDYVYRFVYQSPSPTAIAHPERIKTWLIPYSMWNHYMVWNGRFVAHSIVQYFMQFNSKVPFDICSSLIYLAMILLIDKFGRHFSGKSHNPFILPLIFVFTWFYLPYFGQSVLWLSGSGNYLWMSIIYLGFIFFNFKNRSTDLTNIISAVVLGFLAGATNENSGPAAVLIVLLFMIKRFIQEQKINVISIISVVASGFGFMTMMLSPGSQARGNIHRTWGLVQTNIAGIFKMTIDQWIWLYLLLLILLGTAIFFRKLSMNGVWAVIFFVIGHLAAVYSMAFSPEYPARTFFGGVIFLGIALFIVIYALFSEQRQPMILVSIVASICFLISFIPAYQDINLTYHQMQTEYQIIEKSKSKKVTIPLITMPKSKYNANYGVIALDTPPTALMNQWEAKFFRVDQISGYRTK
ncbi:hypothetical protein CCLMGIMDO_CCLMGIMDO_00345 [Companilactobacillus crustorum]|uniref:Glycosyltransferase RgtA/B/C/D-like domain-containing protein n=1 Tax=Companilactobacillus formosensis TaxID=1617889 RepID=A0A2P4R8B8_9LACO